MELLAVSTAVLARPINGIHLVVEHLAASITVLARPISGTARHSGGTSCS